jgi:signal peptidase II
MIWLEPTLAAAAVLVADRLSKALVMARGVAAGLVPERRLFAIRPLLNRRGVFGSFGGRPGLLAMWAATVVIAALVLHSGALAAGSLGPVGIGAAVGGATGNLLDQLRRGAVVDFIAIGWWPAFNVADAAIVVGVGLILWSLALG